jgi:hypothetical protein
MGRMQVMDKIAGSSSQPGRFSVAEMLSRVHARSELAGCRLDDADPALRTGVDLDREGVRPVEGVAGDWPRHGRNVPAICEQWHRIVAVSGAVVDL